MTGLSLEEIVEVGELAMAFGVEVRVEPRGRLGVRGDSRRPEQFRDVGHPAKDVSNGRERDRLLTHEEGGNQSGDEEGRTKT